MAYRQAAPVLVIMRPDHPLAKFGAVTLAQLQPYALALPERENTVRQLFDIACSRRQLAFDPALVSASFEALTSFVLHGAQLRERGMAERVVEVQTLTGRTLPEGARHFLAALKRQLPAHDSAPRGFRHT